MSAIRSFALTILIGSPIVGTAGLVTGYLLSQPPVYLKALKPEPIVQREFGQDYQYGDLLVTIMAADCRGIGGHYYGQWKILDGTMVHVRVKNTHASKVIEWPGWHGKGILRDEHGNECRPISVAGWTRLPSNSDPGWAGDVGARVMPGETYNNALYFQSMAGTAREAIVTVPLDGKLIQFHGPMTLP